jgi:hypothetical protein
MFARVSIVMMVVAAVILLLPLGLAAVKKAKKRYDQMGEGSNTESSKEENDW